MLPTLQTFKDAGFQGNHNTCTGADASEVDVYTAEVVDDPSGEYHYTTDQCVRRELGPLYKM